VAVFAVLTVSAAGVLLWLLFDLRAGPRRRRSAQRERAARLRLELSRIGR